MKIANFKSGWWTSFSRDSGWYVVKVYNARGDLHDKMRCNDYRMACDYLRAFRAIAKNA